MPAYEAWLHLLEQWNVKIGSRRRDLVPEDQRKIALERPASRTAIERAEARLGAHLPPSYTTFLQVSNGWHIPGYFVDRVRPVEEIDWFCPANREWADAYITTDPSLHVPNHEYFVYGRAQDPSSMRGDYLLTALQISDIGDSAVMLLNPEIRTTDGDWEAWFFANWHAGAVRYASFWDLMVDTFESYGP